MKNINNKKNPNGTQTKEFLLFNYMLTSQYKAIVILKESFIWNPKLEKKKGGDTKLLTLF